MNRRGFLGKQLYEGLISKIDDMLAELEKEHPSDSVLLAKSGECKQMLTDKITEIEATIDGGAK